MLGEGRNAAEAWWPWPQRPALLLAGVVLPVSGLVLMNVVIGGLFWEADSSSSKTQLMLSWKSSLPFYPLLLYSVVSLALVLFRPGQFAGRGATRFGVFTGALMALHYCIVVMIALEPGNDPQGVLFSWLVAIVAGQAGVAFVSAVARRPNGIPKVFLVVGGILVPLFCTCLPFVFVAMLFCAPPWALAAYGFVTWRTASQTTAGPLQFTLAQLFALVTWVAVYLAALQWSIRTSTGG